MNLGDHPTYFRDKLCFNSPGISNIVKYDWPWCAAYFESTIICYRKDCNFRDENELRKHIFNMLKFSENRKRMFDAYNDYKQRKTGPVMRLTADGQRYGN